MRQVVILVGLMAAAPAHADDGRNVLAGPLLGVRLDRSPGSHLVFGVEGGVGWGPERLNLGYERRLGHGFAYVELDPWLYVGASLGVGVTDDGNVEPVVGLWEGIPLNVSDLHCTGWDALFTLAVGYRYTGVHELYATLKGGAENGGVCLD